MAEARRWFMQLPVFALAALLIAWLSAHLPYRRLPPDAALIRLSFSHAGEPLEECRRLTAEELARLAPNMRAPLDCNRERVPLLLELKLDGAWQVREILPPTGLAGDGPAHAYHNLVVAAGAHEVELRLRDNRAQQGHDWEYRTVLELDAGQLAAIDFAPEHGGFRVLGAPPP